MKLQHQQADDTATNGVRYRVKLSGVGKDKCETDLVYEVQVLDEAEIDQETYLTAVRERNMDVRAFWERNLRVYEVMIKSMLTLSSSAVGACALAMVKQLTNLTLAIHAMVFLIISLALILIEMVISMTTHMNYATRVGSNEPGEGGAAPDSSIVTMLIIASIFFFIAGLSCLMASCCVQPAVN